MSYEDKRALLAEMAEIEGLLKESGDNEPGLLGGFNSLTTTGFPKTIDALKQGTVTYDEAMENTKIELEHRYGEDNVRQVSTNRGVVDFETRDEQGKWKSEEIEGSLLQARRMEQAKWLSEADLESGLSAGSRFKKGWKKNKHGEYNYLRETYDDENVRIIEDSQGGIANFLVREKEGEKFKLADPDKAELADLLDIGNETMEMVPGAVGGAAGAYVGSRFGHPVAGEMVGSFAGDVIGQVGSYLADKMVPGDSGLTAEDQLKAGLGAVGTGAVTGGVLHGAGSLVRKISPSQRFEKELSKRFRGKRTDKELNEILVDAEKLEKELGVDLDLADIVDLESGYGVRNALRGHVDTADVMKSADELATEKLAKKFDGSVKFLHKNANPKLLARKVGNSYKDLIKKMTKNKSKDWEENFDSVINSFDPSVHYTGIKAHNIMSQNNMFNTMEELMSKYSEPLYGEEGKNIVEYLTNLKGSLAKNSTLQGDKVLINPIRFKEQFSVLSGKTKGARSSLIKGINVGKENSIRRKLHSAMQVDLEDTITMGGLSEEVASGLNKARTNYAVNMRNLEGVKDEAKNLIFKELKIRDGEDFAKKILKYGDQDIRKIKATLKEVDPEVEHDFMASALTELMGEGSQITLKKLSKLAEDPKQAAKIGALLGDTPGAIKIIRNMNKIRKVADKKIQSGKGGIPKVSTDFLNKWLKGVPLAQGMYKHLQESLVPLAKPEKLAEALLDKRQRKILLKLTNPKPGKMKVGSVAFTRLATQLGRLALEDEPNE